MEKNNEPSGVVIKRIVLIGPESTGKTTLAEQLANHYKTVWVQEYAREYIDGLKRKYTLEDIQIIAKKQIELEDKQAKLAKTKIFCDTDLIVCKIWAENAFGKCPEWILDEIRKRHYDFYILADIDLLWTADGQREHQGQREYFLNKYKNDLASRKVKYGMVSGTGKDRLRNAIRVLEKKM